MGIFRVVNGGSPERYLTTCGNAAKIVEQYSEQVPIMKISYKSSEAYEYCPTFLTIANKRPSVVMRMMSLPLATSMGIFSGENVIFDKVTCDANCEDKFPNMEALTIGTSLDDKCLVNYPELTQLTFNWPLSTNKWYEKVSKVKKLATLRILNAPMYRIDFKKLAMVKGVPNLFTICMSSPAEGVADNVADMIGFLLDERVEFETINVIFANVDDEVFDKAILSEKPKVGAETTKDDAGVIANADMVESDVDKYLASLAKRCNEILGNFIQNLKKVTDKMDATKVPMLTNIDCEKIPMLTFKV